MKKKLYYSILGIIFLVFLCVGLQAQNIEEYAFYFQGYRTQLRAMANDEKGNVLFTGTLYTEENDPAQRDPVIDSLLKNASPFHLNHNHGITIMTDRSLQVKNVKVFPFLYPETVLYEADQNCFWLGGSKLVYDRNSPGLSGQWQVVLLRFYTDEKKWYYSDVATNFSCHLNDIALGERELVLTAVKDSVENEAKWKIPVVLTISTVSLHKGNRGYPKIQDNLQVITTQPPFAPHILSTSTAVSYDHTWFGVTSFTKNQDKTTGINLYHYAQGMIESRPFFTGDSQLYFYYLTNCIGLQDSHFLLAYVPSPTSKYFVLQKVNQALETIWKQQVNDAQYPDFYNELLEMPDGKIVALGANPQKTWSCYVYSSTGVLLREIDTRQSVSLRVSFSQVWSERSFITSFVSLTDPDLVVMLIIEID